MQPRQPHSEKWGSTEQPSSDLSFVQGHCHKGHVREEVSVGSQLGLTAPCVKVTWHTCFVPA